MAKPDFTSVLDMNPNEIERPKPLPPGGYICIIKDRPVQDKSSQKETPYIEFALHPVEALDNVDEDWLNEALTRANGEKKKLADMVIRARFYDTQEAGYRLKKFLLDDCQLENSGSIGQIIESAIGCQVIANIKHRSVEGDTFVDLKSTAPVNPPETKKVAGRR
jgi:hypothetical protein